MSRRITAADLLGDTPAVPTDSAGPAVLSAPVTPVDHSQRLSTLASLIAGIAGGLLLGFMLWGGLPGGRERDDRQQEQKHEQKQSLVDAKGVWVTIVEETSDRANHPYISSIISDLDFWESLKARGMIGRPSYDRDSNVIKPYLPDAEKVGVPALLVISPQGEVLIAKPCPESTAGIQTELEKVFGK